MNKMEPKSPSVHGNGESASASHSSKFGAICPAMLSSFTLKNDHQNRVEVESMTKASQPSLAVVSKGAVVVANMRFISSLKRMVCIVVYICRCRCLSTQFSYHKTHVLEQTNTATHVYVYIWCMRMYIHIYNIYVYMCIHTHTLWISIYIYISTHILQLQTWVHPKASQYPSHLLTEAPYQKVEDSTASSALSCNAIRCWHFDVFQPRPLGSFWGMGMFAIDLLLEKHILKECKKCLCTCNLPKCRTKDSLQSLSFEKQFVYISTSQLSTNILILFKKYQWSECGEKFRGSKGTTLKLAPWPRHKVPKTSLSRPCLVTLREGNLNN